jgi:hypothetical protein
MAQNIIGFKRCQKNHLLGQMRADGNGNVMLVLFRQAIDYGEDMPEPVDVIGLFPVGFEIRCSICGGIIDWHESRPRHAPRVAFE